MKLYIISGLGADSSVFEHIEFPHHMELHFIDWLVPEQDEEFDHYVNRMAESINPDEDFCLLGYSFGGIIVQEIHKKIPAKKVLILGCIKSSQGKSKLMKLGRNLKIHKIISTSAFNENSFQFYAFIRHLFDPKNPKVLKYFTMKNPYYLKWSIENILNWNETTENPSVIQILADKDIVFPIKNSNPNYVIKGATHLFPVTKAKEVSAILEKEFREL